MSPVQQPTLLIAVRPFRLVVMDDARYTHGHHESVLRSHRWRTAENSAAYLLPLLAPGMSLLDVGCGPGTITVDLAPRVAPGPVVGVDRATEVLAEADALLADRPAANVGFEPGATLGRAVAPRRSA